jgi:hypothetical protein
MSVSSARSLQHISKKSPQLDEVDFRHELETLAGQMNIGLQSVTEHCHHPDSVLLQEGLELTGICRVKRWLSPE